MSVEIVALYGVSLCSVPILSYVISIFDVGGSGESGEKYDVS